MSGSNGNGNGHKPKPTTGRPPKDIDPEQVEKLARLMCTNEEIADILNCSADTLVRRFADVIKRARAHAKHRLRSSQWKLACGSFDDNGDPIVDDYGKLLVAPDKTLQVWLGKQYLDQRDAPPEPVDLTTPMAPETNVIERADSNEPTTRPVEPGSSIPN